MSDDIERALVEAQVNVCFRRALDAHLAGIEPGSNYASTLATLAHSTERGTLDTPQAREWFVMLMRDMPHPIWRPTSRDFLNWLFFHVSGLRRRHWQGWTTEQLTALLALLQKV